jgi:HK97 family phage major capsid protein
MSLNALREQRAAKTAEARTLLGRAESEKRSLTSDETATFDTLKATITDLEAQEARAQFLDDAERRASGTVIHGDRSVADLESRVSLMAVIRAQMEGRALTGAEAEYHAETERRTGRKATGLFVPMSALERRVNTTTSAADLVGTDHRADQYIEPLRNKLLARRLGVRVLSGLRGNVSIPKHGTSVTSGWVAENSNLTPSDMTFDAVTLTPKHVGALSEMSRQLIQQSDPSIEQLLRDDMSFAIAQAIDSALIQGGGANEPDGILSTVGVQTGTLATPTWLQVLEMLEKLELVNASPNAWLTAPGAATVLRSTLKSASSGAGFLLDGGRMADLPAWVTNQVPGTTDGGTVILGDFSQAMLGIWSELDILVNPYESTAYARGGVAVRAMATVDVGIRHPEAFVVASDA